MVRALSNGLAAGAHVTSTLQIVIDHGNKDGYQAVMEARDQLLLLGRSTPVVVDTAEATPVGALMVEDEQTGEVRPISKKERQRFKREARKAKKQIQSKEGATPALRTESGKEVMQIGDEVFYEDDGAEMLSGNTGDEVERAEGLGVIGSHVVAPVSITLAVLFTSLR